MNGAVNSIMRVLHVNRDSLPKQPKNSRDQRYDKSFVYDGAKAKPTGMFPRSRRALRMHESNTVVNEACISISSNLAANCRVVKMPVDGVELRSRPWMFKDQKRDGDAERNNVYSIVDE